MCHEAADVLSARRPELYIVATPCVTANHDALVELTRGRLVWIGFDQDFYTNETVCFHLASLVARRLRRERTLATTRIASWDARVKGIDDAAVRNLPIKSISVQRWLNGLLRRSPRGCARSIGWEKFFVKDHVKSLKTSVGSIIEDPEQNWTGAFARSVEAAEAKADAAKKEKKAERLNRKLVESSEERGQKVRRAVSRNRLAVRRSYNRSPPSAGDSRESRFSSRRRASNIRPTRSPRSPQAAISNACCRATWHCWPIPTSKTSSTSDSPNAA